ncbi:MAG TPA: hypothetical protein ACFYD4_06195 [Candidatus Wunengus sp. YC61]|uniref:hypothetical protein n=1 Tax=Candidatus Wunengus sp. YC61 TaxID=3367698 RepID=UPI0040269418
MTKGEIIKTYLCEKCGHVTWNVDEYKKHKVDHQLGKVTKFIHPVTGEELDQPKPDAPVDVSKPAPVAPQEAPKPEVPVSVVIKPEVLELTYVYKGNCGICRTNVETINLEGVAVKTKTIIVAWCPVCKKNVTQRIVARL